MELRGRARSGTARPRPRRCGGHGREALADPLAEGLELQLVGGLHRRLELAGVGLERGQLGRHEAADVLGVVGLVGLPEQQRRGPVRGEALLGEEVRVAGGDDALAGQETGVAVVGVEPVALPRVVAEHHLGPQLAEHPAHLGPSGQVARSSPSTWPRNTTSPVAAERLRRGALLVAGVATTSATVSADASQVPFEPSVSTRWCTTQPAAAHLASVPPAPNSTSSGWAPMARAERRYGAGCG